MLPDLLVAVLFGVATPPPALAIGLAGAGAEVVDDGYLRATVLRGDWQIVGPQASVVVEFGPFDEPVRFDEVFIVAGGDVLDRTALEGEIALLAGMTYEHRYVVRVGVTDG